jgi:hypothetical protein
VSIFRRVHEDGSPSQKHFCRCVYVRKSLLVLKRWKSFGIGTVHFVNLNVIPQVRGKTGSLPMRNNDLAIAGAAGKLLRGCQQRSRKHGPRDAATCRRDSQLAMIREIEVLRTSPADGQTPSNDSQRAALTAKNLRSIHSGVRRAFSMSNASTYGKDTWFDQRRHANSLPAPSRISSPRNTYYSHSHTTVGVSDSLVSNNASKGRPPPYCLEDPRIDPGIVCSSKGSWSSTFGQAG